MGSALTLLAVALAQWVTGFLVLGRLLCRRTRSDSAAGGGAAAGSVSIIIPARNEERNLPVLLGSLASQSLRPREIIVVDDSSTDATAEVARRFGARVVTSEPLPEGWRGKTWACWQGAGAATGDRLLFLDADTWFAPDGLRQILEYHRGGVLSVGPYHDVRRPYEQLSAFFNLMMTAGMGAFGLLHRRPAGLFGQMLLVNRADYLRVGGHESVKGRILENFALAERFRDAGIPMRCDIGGRAFAFRMYPEGVGQLIEGWTKGFASGAARTGGVLMLLIVLWLGGMVLSMFMLTQGWVGALMYGLYAAQLHLLLRRIGSFRWYTSLLYPVPLVFFVLVFIRSWSRSGRQVTWKGRRIDAD